MPLRYIADMPTLTCMKDMINPELRASRAYKIFMEELSNGLSQFETLLIEDSQLGHELVAKLSNDFHRVKGGAGFFGLAKVCAIAGEAEQLLNGVNVLSDQDRKLLQKYVKELREEEQSLGSEGS